MNPKENGSSKISSYKSDGTLISSAIGTGVANAAYFGVDVYGANGNVYAIDAENKKAYIFGPTGTTPLVEMTGADCTEGAFGAMEKPDLAVDQSNGNVLVSDIKGHGVVDEFNAAGKCIDTIKRSSPAFTDAKPSDIAVDGSGTNKGEVYITSGTSSGSVYAYEKLEPQFALTVTPTPGRVELFSAMAAKRVTRQRHALAPTLKIVRSPSRL